MSPNIFELIQQLCPDGVEYRRLGEVFKRERGTSITAARMKDMAVDEGDVRVFAGGKTEVRVFSSDIPGANILKSPSVLVQSRGVIDVIYCDEPFTFKNEMWAYTHDNLVFVRFLFYLLKCHVVVFRRIASKMGSMPQISLSVTDDLQIPAPPIQVQQEIVRILDAFDTYCNDMTSGLAGELAMRRKQFQYWRETLIAQQTDHMVALGDLGQFQNGHGISKSELMDEGPVPVIHYGQIYTMYNHAVLKTVSFAGTQTAVSVKAHHGDVVVCLTETADLGFVGKAVAQVSGVDVGVSGDAGVLHLNPEEVDASYLAYVMETQRFQVQKEKCKRGTTVMHLNIPMWKKIRVPVPPLAVQLEIVRILDVFTELERELERELELRVKQFEYYRDHLLVFPKKSAA